MIPPYYRPKHRPNLTLDDHTLASSTVSQLRYVQVSVLQTAAGLNGWQVIKEEKAPGSSFVEVILFPVVFIHIGPNWTLEPLGEQDHPVFVSLNKLDHFLGVNHATGCQSKRLRNSNSHFSPFQAGVLADPKLGLKDDGLGPSSAIEIGTKLVSRELAFKAGAESLRWRFGAKKRILYGYKK